MHLRRRVNLGKKNKRYEGRNNMETAKKKSVIKRALAMRETTVILLIIGIAIILSILSPHFLTGANLSSTALGFAAQGIMVIGTTMVLITGGIDLSIGSIEALAMVVAGALYMAGVDIWIAALAGLAVSAICGVINGLFIGKIGLMPFITTLGMMSIARGAAMICTEGSPISLSGMPDSFKVLGSGDIFGIPIFVIIFLVLTIVADYFFRRSTIMRNVFYTGSNEKAAILSGLNVSRIKFGVYTVAAALAGLAGILSLSRFGVAAPSTGQGAEMDCISAAVIGGASLTGGEGTVYGAALGVVLLNLINNGLIMLNVSVYWQDLVTGVILLAAVTIDMYSHKKRAITK